MFLNCSNKQRHAELNEDEEPAPTGDSLPSPTEEEDTEHHCTEVKQEKDDNDYADTAQEYGKACPPPESHAAPPESGAVCPPWWKSQEIHI